MAKELFAQGYNCAQSVVLAYHDIIGLDKSTAAMASSGFGGGFGRMREVCGCVSGMTFVSGFIAPFTDPSSLSEKKENYRVVQSMAEEYSNINGSIICRELLAGEVAGKPITYEPSERTEEYYQKRPCKELVGIAAEILGRKINELA
jgi:C_GCAxxG_C_C family probable redox protein